MVEKRRRKKARLQDSSSESESSTDDIHDTPEELSDLSEMGEVEAPAVIEERTPRELLHKAPQNSQTDFNQVFLKLVTEQFGEELAALRQSNDFTPASIAQLVAGLKQGADIFSPEQQEMLRTE